MDCYFLDRCGHSGLAAPVQMVCDCLIAICQDCAKREVLITFPSERQKKKIIPTSNELDEAQFDAFLSCPQCQSTVSSTRHNIIHGVEEALAAEESLLRAAMTDVGKSYFKHTTNLVDLKDCWELLGDVYDIDDENMDDPVFSPLPESLFPEAIQVARLRKKIAARTLQEYTSYVNPLDALSFTANKFFEKYMQYPATSSSESLTNASSSASSNSAVWSDTECPLCTSSIRPGQSVQLTCGCQQPMCRTCVLIDLHYCPCTYNNGVHCIMCRKYSPGMFQNTEFIKECEDLLIKSARTYLTNKLLTFRGENSDENICTNLLNMVKMYWCLGYEGNFNVLDAKELNATLPRLRLEVAKLEEMRLNKCGLLDTYSIRNDSIPATTTTNDTTHDSELAGKFPISFMHALKVNKCTFFEHYLKQRSGATTTPVTPSIDTCAVLTKLRQLQQDCEDRLDLLDKIILTCMQVERFSQPSATVTLTSQGTTTGCSVSQMVTMVLNYLKHPAFPYSIHFKTTPVKGNVSEYMNMVSKKITPQTVAACVRKFILNGFVSQVGRSAIGTVKEELYVLSEASLKFALLDPNLSESMQPHYYTAYSLLTEPVAAISRSASDSGSVMVKTESTSVDGTPAATNSMYDTTAIATTSSNSAKLITTATSTTRPSTTTTTTTTVRPPRISDLFATTSTTRPSTTTTSTTTVRPSRISDLFVTTPVQRKRGRPSTLEKAIAQSLETSICSGFYNLAPAPVGSSTNGVSSADAIDSGSGVVSGSSGSGTTTKSSTSIGAGSAKNPPSGIKCGNSVEETRATKLKAKMEKRAQKSSRTTDAPTKRMYRLLHGGQAREYFEHPLSSAECPSDAFTASEGSGDESSYEDRRKKRKFKRSSSSSVTTTPRGTATTPTTASISYAKTNAASTSTTKTTFYDARDGSENEYAATAMDEDNNSTLDHTHDEDDDAHLSESEMSTYSTYSDHSTVHARSAEEEIALMIKTLKEAANEAFEDAARVREENEQLRADIAFTRNSNVADLAVHQIKVEKLNDQIKELNNQIQGQQRQIEENKKAADAAMEAVEALRQEEVLRVEKSVAALNEELRKVTDKCTEYKAKIAEATDKLSAKEHDLKELSIEVEKLKKTNVRVKKEQSDLQRNIEAERKSHAAAMERKNAELKALELEVSKKRETSQIDLNLNGNLTRQLSLLAKQNETISHERDALQRQLQDLIAQKEACDIEARKHKKVLNELIDKNAQQKEEIVELQADVAALKKERKEREEKEVLDNQEMASLFTSLQPSEP